MSHVRLHHFSSRKIVDSQFLAISINLHDTMSFENHSLSPRRPNEKNTLQKLNGFMYASRAYIIQIHNSETQKNKLMDFNTGQSQ